MKGLIFSTQLILIVLIAIIAYNTGNGKIFPVHHPSWLSCDGLLTRNLFYSTLLKQSDDLKEVANHVREASSLAEVDRLVTSGSNINASRTLWFESVSEAGKCEAQVFLNSPDKDGNNTAYIGFVIAGYSPPSNQLTERLLAEHVLQSIQLDMLGVKWFKE